VRRAIARASLVLLLVSVIGFFVSLFLIPLVFDEFDAYGEVPIPGTRTLHLPAEDVTISFHSVYPKGDMDKCIPIPEGLKVTITPPKGVAEPTTAGTDLVCDNDTDTDDERRTVQVARIPQVGDYTITTSGNVTEFASPRVAFGHPSRFGFLPWLFAGLGVVSLAAFFVVHMHWGTRLARTASADWPPFSFTDTGGRSSAPPPATEGELRRQNWAAIDGLVAEFFPEAIRRETRMRGVFQEYWLVRRSWSERDHLLIFKNGGWSLRGLDNGYIVETTSSTDPDKKGPRETTVVDGLREGALRLLNNR
jgi:hypothetical protein